MMYSDAEIVALCGRISRFMLSSPMHVRLRHDEIFNALMPTIRRHIEREAEAEHLLEVRP